MDDDWILDVLTDLKGFAETNGLPFLAVTLEDALRIAEIELASRLAENPSLRQPDPARTRPVPIYPRRHRSGQHDA